MGVSTRVSPGFFTIIFTTLLCAARFLGGHCLRVYLKRDPAGSVPQKLLNGLYVFAVRLQKSSDDEGCAGEDVKT